MRLTHHQASIYDLLKRARGPMSADEIRMEMRNSKIGLATVYRALKKGVEEGVLREVEFPNGGTRYESENISHHHHFVCEKCDGAFDIEGCPKSITKLLPEDFLMTRHEIFFYGYCPECKESGVSSS